MKKILLKQNILCDIADELSVLEIYTGGRVAAGFPAEAYNYIEDHIDMNKYLLLTDGKQTIDKLKKTKINRNLEKKILVAIDGKVLRKNGYEEIVKKCGATKNELFKIILRHNLNFKSFPFKIQKGNRNEIFRKVFIENKKYDDLAINKYPTLFK